MFPSVCLSVCGQKIAFFVINLRNLVKFAQIWQNSSDFFDFLFLFDFQMSESKHFLLNLPQSPPFHQNLAISRHPLPRMYT